MELHIRRDSGKPVVALLSLASQLGGHEMASHMAALLRDSAHGIRVSISPYKPERTREQENYYRKRVAEFASFCGTTPDEMHEYMLCEAFGSEEVPTRVGVFRRPLRRSSSARVDEYAALIDTLIRIAGDMGFTVQPPIKEATDDPA